MIIPKGSEHVEIIGTTVIPEFGTIAMMILVVAIISIVAVTAKSRVIARF
jgi:predicted secreted protein with PEFG-CTERM motif